MTRVEALAFLTLSVATMVGATPAVAAGGGDVEIEHLDLPGMEDRGLPFSSAVRAGDMLYLSGVIGTIPGTLDVPDSIEQEARFAMERIEATLERFGSSMDRVVKCTVFMADERYRDAFNEVYTSYFEQLPARSGVTVAGLALGARVEVECIAVVG